MYKWTIFLNSKAVSLQSFLECLNSVQFSSVAQSCPTLCDPMNHSTPDLPVHHQLQEFTETHVHRVGAAIQLSHPLSSPSPPAPNPSQHQGMYRNINKRSQDKTRQAPLGRVSLLSKEKLILISTALLKYSLFLSVNQIKAGKIKEIGKVTKVKFHLTYRFFINHSITKLSYIHQNDIILSFCLESMEQIRSSINM